MSETPSTSENNFEEFIVCRDKVRLIETLKGKVERLFGTRVYFKEASRVGDKENRWVLITGGKWDRQNAKAFILGFCNPEETKIINGIAEFIDNEILENIEKSTQAILERISVNQVKISGNELSVTLALSSLEELTNFNDDVPTDGTIHDTEEALFEGRRKSTSLRLDEQLNQTFGDSSESLQHYPDSIKRVFLQCGNHSPECDDIPEEMLHGSGGSKWDSPEASKQSNSGVIEGSNENATDTPKTVTASIVPRQASGGETLSDGTGGRKSPEGLLNVMNNLSATQISEGEVNAQKLVGANADELKEFAMKVGYTVEEVHEGFLYVKLPMSPKDFINVLLQVKSAKEQLGPVAKIASGSCSSDGDDLMILEDCSQFPTAVTMPLRPSTTREVGGLQASDLRKNPMKQKNMDDEFQHQHKKKKKSKSPQSSGVKSSDSDSDPEQTHLMTVWDNTPSSSHANDSEPVKTLRYQKIVGPDSQPGSVGNAGGSASVPVYAPVSMYPNSVQASARAGANNSSSQNYSNQQIDRGAKRSDQLRYVVIDGSNVAMCHGKNKIFSCKGIRIAVDYFIDLGHKVTVFIPEWRKYRNYHDNKIRDQEILHDLEESEHLVFTPSRKINGRLVASYDDRFILTLAEKEDSIILSNDQYRDLMREKFIWKKIIDERLLMYRFVSDHFMPAEDPLGRNGPMLQEFLRKKTNAAIVTTSNTHRYPIHHPQPVMWQTSNMRPPLVLAGSNQSQNSSWQSRPRHQNPPTRQPRLDLPAKRNSEMTEHLLGQLQSVFSESWQEDKVKSVLYNHSCETDLNRLTNYCMEAIFP